MVQEFHVLRCFLCNTFQSHIVKKINKWECKICGIKQSVKKEYGRGTGKDCRIHTQKLNALRGQKEETESHTEHVEETTHTELSVRNVPEDPSHVFRRSSKWAEFVDENEIIVKQNYSSKSETTHSVPTKTNSWKRKTKDNIDDEDNMPTKTKSWKRRRKDNLGDEEVKGFPDDFNSVAESYSMALSNHSLGYSNRRKCDDLTKSCCYDKNAEIYLNVHETSTKSMENAKLSGIPHKSNIGLNGKWLGYLENEDEERLIKISSLNTTKPVSEHAKASLKWAKYLEEEEEEDNFSYTQTSSKRRFKDKEDVVIKKITSQEDVLGDSKCRNNCAGVRPTHHHYLETSDPSDFSDHYGSMHLKVMRISDREVEHLMSNSLNDTSANHSVSYSKVKSSGPNSSWSLQSVNCSVSNGDTDLPSPSDTNKNSLIGTNKLKENNVSEGNMSCGNEFNIKFSDNSVKNDKRKVNPETVSLPVFEQNCELSDSDFQLDF